MGETVVKLKRFSVGGTLDNTTDVLIYAYDRLFAGNARNDIARWITPDDKKAYFGSGPDQIDCVATSELDLGVIEPFVRVSQRAGVSVPVDFAVHRFALRTWCA